MQDFSQHPSHGGNLVWAAQQAGCSPQDLLDFSASINPLGPPQTAIAAIHRQISALTHYPDPHYQQLRQALAAFHDLPAEWILPGNGSAELLTWAGREFADLEATYLITPGFGDYFRALNAFGALVVGCPIALEFQESSPDRFTGFQDGIPLPPLLDQTDSDLTRSGLLLNNPHNPTGCLFATTDLIPLLERYGLVVVDEAFMDFLPPDRQPSLIPWIQRYPNLVILRSLTKFYSLPGLRLGYVIAHPERLQRWQQWRDPWAVNVLAEAAALAVLPDTAFQQQTWDWLTTARSQLADGLATLPGLDPFPGAANFLLVRSEYSVSALQHQLLHHRILIRDCLSFPELGDHYFRVAVRRIAENQRLLDGLHDILQTMA